MKAITKTIAGLEMVQIGRVVRDINAAVKFFAKAMGITPEGWTVIEQVQKPHA